MRHAATHAQSACAQQRCEMSEEERRVSRSEQPLDKRTVRVSTAGAVKLGTLVTCMSLWVRSGRF